MKNDRYGAQSMPGTMQPPQKRKRVAYTLGAIALACLLCLIFALFARSYQSLRDAILLERIDYVEEISAQIMTSQLFMEREYSETASNLANVLAHENVASLDDVHAYLISKDKADILLLSEENDIVDLNGRHISMPNDTLMRKMLHTEGVTELFTSLNYAEDSWLFACPIPTRIIDGTAYKAVILSVSADTFRSNMTISLFDDRGASYIINNDGRIKIKPLENNVVFNGYNLFSSMLAQGAPAEDIEQLKRDLNSGEAGSNLIQAGDFDWLVGHASIDNETSIIVAIPLTLTAAQTYRGLDRTILLSSFSVTLVALIAILLILQFFRRDRQREKEALAVAAKSEFFSKMSHDIRTPLNAVIGLVQLAEDETRDPTVKGYLSQSSTAAKYLLSIINDVLEVSRIESGKLIIGASPFDMRALLSEVSAVATPLALEKKLVFTEETDDGFDTEYIGDAVRIEQILTNLLSNAIKFTKPGGHVGLRVTRTARPDGYDAVTMVVSDTGIGMSEAFLRHIFTPFEQEHSSYTQQYAGSGLGLSIVHNLVKQMHGTIDVTSRLGEGSTFTVTLPLLRGTNRVPATRAAASAPPTFPGKRALLAEDNVVNQTVAAKLLSQKFMVETDIAPDGNIAVSMFGASAPGAYDIIFMDVKMPNMDGLAATRAIRALPRPDARTIPIIAISANAYSEDMALSLAAGMDGHLPKPLDIAALTAVLQRYLS